MTRAVTWGGIHNARDLGGLPGRRGTTVRGRVFRMPRPDALDETGWRELEAAGVRTLIDLRNDNEIAELPLRPATVASLIRSIEDQTDEEFMAQYGTQLGSPVYYAENLRRWPGLVAGAIAAIADAPAGGVVIHCAAGRDRTGLIVALVLELCGVHRTSILDDYELGVRETNEFLRSHSHPHERTRAESELAPAIAESRAVLDGLLDDLDVENFLRDRGITSAQVEGIRSRLLA